MRKVTYFCDRCGKQVLGNIFQIGFRTINTETGEQVEEEFNAEFCLDCYQIVDDAVAAAVMSVNQKPEPEPAPKKRKAPNKADLDMGKVHALKNAGWSADKIGEEFGVSGQTILNRLRAEEENA